MPKPVVVLTPRERQWAQTWNPDPIFQTEDKLWHFWNETWSDECGQYLTEEEAREMLRRYCNWLDTGYTV